MEPINGVGQTAYQMPVQPQDEMIDGYSSMPMMYDEEYETKKNASSNMLGMTALGALALGSAIYGGVKHHKVKGINKELALVKAEKAELEAIKADLEKQLNELKPEKKPGKWQRFKESKWNPANWFKKNKKDGGDTPKIDDASDVKPTKED